MTPWWNPAHSSKQAHRSRMLRTFAEDIRDGKSISSHSAQASTLPVIVGYLEAWRVPYIITAIPGVGYTVSRGPHDVPSGK